MTTSTRLATFAGLLLAAWAAPGVAVTPLTPRLAAATQQALLAGLTRAGLPDVAQNSVVIAVTAALGFEPKATTFTHEQAAPHLPRVVVGAEPAADGCARVDARVTLDPAALRVRGTYCLVGAAEWRSVDQVVTAGSRREAPR
jgi:hypothetical protein